MYTVIRFTAPAPADWTALTWSSAAFRHRHPDRHDGSLDKAPGSDRFSIGLSRSSDASEHVAEVARFILADRRLIAEAVAAGLEVALDVAIDEEDRQGRPYWSLGLDLRSQRFLSRLGVSVGITIY